MRSHGSRCTPADLLDDWFMQRGRKRAPSILHPIVVAVHRSSLARYAMRERKSVLILRMICFVMGTWPTKRLNENTHTQTQMHRRCNRQTCAQAAIHKTMQRTNSLPNLAKRRAVLVVRIADAAVAVYVCRCCHHRRTHTQNVCLCESQNSNLYKFCTCIYKFEFGAKKTGPCYVAVDVASSTEGDDDDDDGDGVIWWWCVFVLYCSYCYI